MWFLVVSKFRDRKNLTSVDVEDWKKETDKYLKVQKRKMKKVKKDGLKEKILEEIEREPLVTVEKIFDEILNTEDLDW